MYRDVDDILQEMRVDYEEHPDFEDIYHFLDELQYASNILCTYHNPEGGYLQSEAAWEKLVAEIDRLPDQHKFTLAMRGTDPSLL